MTVVEVQNDDGTYREIRVSGRRPWVVEQGTSDTDAPAPKLRAKSDSRESVDAGQNIRVRDGSTTIFDGRITDAPIQGDGNRPIDAEHNGFRLLEEEVTLSVSGTDEDVFQAAINNSTRSGTFSLSYAGTATSLGDTYDVEGRKISRVFRDMADRVGRVFWIDGTTNTVNVEPYGGAGTMSDIKTSEESYSARLEEFDDSDLKTVVNEATVVGTGGEKVTGFDEDLTSKSDYGRQPKRVQVSYVTSQSEADAYASELLVPDPLPSAEATVDSRHPDSIETPLVNRDVRINDPSNSVDVTVPVEKQTITPGQATFTAGEGAVVNVEEFNRTQKSRGDTTEPGSVYGEDRIGDEAISEQKMQADAIASATLQNGVVTQFKLADGSVIESKVDTDAITETKIEDDSISTPKLQANVVEAPKIETNTITGTEFQRVVDGEVVDTTNIITLNSDKVVFGSGDDLTDVTGDDGGITVIEGDRIRTGSIDADKIDTLRLLTDQLELTDDNNNSLLAFNTPGTDEVEVLPEADFSRLGTDFDEWDEALIRNINPANDDDGRIGNSFAAHEEIWAHDFINAVTGDSIISNDGGDPLEGLAAEPRPPEYCRVCDDDGNDAGVSINKLTEELWSICSAQQRVIEDLEERLSKLEADHNA